MCNKCDGHGYYYDAIPPRASSVTSCDCGIPAPQWVLDIRQQIEKDGHYISINEVSRG